MKKIFSRLFISSLVVVSVLVSCNKDVSESYADLDPVSPLQTDENAGKWKTVVLDSARAIAVPAPDAVSSSAYQAELAKVKAAMAGLTGEQKAAIDYWAGGGVLRWNQIMRALVAKYNLAPAEGADGTYPVPDASNPLAYPYFPFANPPYAARAYAYVSVAQYDALVAAYAYKKQYNRAAPYQADNSIKPLVPASTLPSYPCEDAVIAAATLEVMKSLFPGEISYLEQKAGEEKFYKMWAGAATESDILAGEALGKAVAQRVLTRAKTDGAKSAIGTSTYWDSLANAAVLKGEIPWKSQETPARPPMLPLYGKVRPWLFDAATVVTLRSPEPPSVHSAEFKKQLEEVRSYADNPTRERMRIVHFWADGAGTYTPPGHWNAFAFDLIYQARQSEVRAARNFALLNMAMMDAAVCCWDIKYAFFVPRPSQMDPAIKTLTGLPNFPSYTSGHSTFSGSASTILGHIFPAASDRFKGYAEEASLSRLYGGIHYRMDCDAGLQCGRAIGQYAVNRAKQDGAE